MKRSAAAALGAALIMSLGTISASQAAVFRYTFESFDSTVGASGVLDAISIGGAEYLVTDISGKVFGLGVGVSPDGITGLAPVNPGGFYTDNLVFSGSNPALDVDGIGFYTASGLTWNVWGNSANNYSLYSFNGGGYPVQEGGNLTVTAVPETSAWAMMLIGFAGLGLAGFRRTKIGPPLAA